MDESTQKRQGQRLESDEGVSLESEILPSKDVLFTVVDGQAVLLDQGSDIYYGLDPIGTRMWQLMTGGASVGEAVDDLLTEYEADADQVRRDLIDLIGELLEGDLVQLVERLTPG